MVLSSINGQKKQRRHDALPARLGNAFDSECSQKFGFGCSLGKAIPELAGKGYKDGSPFNNKFSVDNISGNANTELQLEILKDGTASYKSFDRIVPRFYTLKDIDSVSGGRRIRSEIERILRNIALYRSGKNGNMSDGMWSIHLFASSHKKEGSLLVLNVERKDSYKKGNESFFIVASTSKKLESDARAVEKFMENSGRNALFIGC